MSDNPLDPSPAFLNRVKSLAEELWKADGSPAGRQAEYRERADELARMEAAGATGLRDVDAPAQIVEEASIQENLGEFPSGVLGDEGRFMQTPMTRDKMLNTDEADLPEGGTAA